MEVEALEEEQFLAGLKNTPINIKLKVFSVTRIRCQDITFWYYFILLPCILNLPKAALMWTLKGERSLG